MNNSNRNADTPAVWTIKTLLDWTQGFFQAKKIASARLDAELLLAHVLNLKRIELYLKFDQPVGTHELQNYKKLIMRRADWEPVAYILGEKEFYSRPFAVNRDVLIPRPDSEVLIEKTLARFSGNSEEIWQGLEVGVGSGCLAITLLCQNPKIQMTGCDVSEAALTVCTQNAKTHGVADRLQLVHTDWLKTYSSTTSWAGQAWDFLISNPPYISDSEFLQLQKNVKDFEPALALQGGPAGLVFYPTLAEFAKKHLKPAGFVIVEIGETQGAPVCDIFKQHGFTHAVCEKDYSGLDRVVIAYQ